MPHVLIDVNNPTCFTNLESDWAAPNLKSVAHSVGLLVDMALLKVLLAFLSLGYGANAWNYTGTLVVRLPDGKISSLPGIKF